MRLDEQLDEYAITSDMAKVAREANDDIKALQHQLDAAIAENRNLRSQIMRVREILRDDRFSPWRLLHAIDMATSADRDLSSGGSATNG